MYKIPQNIECIIFDLDGTLIDSTWIWREIDKIYLARYQKTAPENLQEIIEGMSFTETALYVKKRFGIEETVEKIKADWNALAFHYYENVIELKIGAKSFVKEMYKRNIQLGIGTSNMRNLTELVLKRHGILKYFKTIRTSCEVGKGKPHPDVFLKVSEDLKCAPERCLVFEDTLSGIVSANNAHMQVIGIQDAFSIQNEHKIQTYVLKYIENFEKMK